MAADDPFIPVAIVAAQLSEQDAPLLFVAADEQRALAVATLAQAFTPDRVVAHVPSSDALPGDEAPASPANVGGRVAALRRVRAALADGKFVLLVTSAEAIAVRHPAPSAFDAAPPRVTVGDAIDLAAFGREAEEIGYVADDRVDEPGEFAVRGEIVDLYPADSDAPVRIEVVDGRVTGIRSYDAASQRTAGEHDAVEVGRAQEAASTGGVTLLDHLPEAALALDPGVTERRDRFLAIAADRGLRGRKQEGLVSAAAWDRAAEKRRVIDLAAADGDVARFVEHRAPMRAFAGFAAERLRDGALVVAGGARDLRFLGPRLAKATKTAWRPVGGWVEVASAKTGDALLLDAVVDHGFGRGAATVVAAADLLGGRAEAPYGAAAPIGAGFAEAGNLAIGDAVIHEEFGLGVIDGIEALDDAGDALALRYAKEARRLVPVADADRVWRYGGEAEGAALDTLDGASWRKRRGAIDAAVAESARTLSALAAERAARRTDPIEPDAAAYERFAAGFGFTETADQARAIGAVRRDLASGSPMDRLVVGDVGYGKTEVALRAAALVALTGRQVVVTAPTTVLVRQHLETFARRFEGTGIEVAGLSRLSNAAEKKRVKAGLADGTIGVLIGTGAVAGKGVVYRDLALVVVDEEQRFGAAAKAKLAALGAGHVLTLSATPIPRTLQSALVGLQQISVIATPPARRQPIRTAVLTWEDAAVRAALRREHGRGGQSFVVVPRIEDMAPLAERLRRLVPELSVVEAHGKLAAADIDAAMVAFARGEGDVLLATNIVEAGLDVPRANTMIVHRADRFGLAQLHQLRGRVGRGGRRGQVLLTTEADGDIAPATLKRLRALQAFDRLGAGFAIAARDLDLRGAGDLIGEDQSGHLKLIGVDLYQYLLGQALRQVRGEDVDTWTPELNLGRAGRLPANWIPEEAVRVALYGRLARLDRGASIDAFEEELEDRFGPIPDDAQALLAAARLRRLARAAGVVKVDAGPAAIALTPRRKGPPPAGLEDRDGRWLLAERIEDEEERIVRIEAILADLAAAG